MTRGSTARGHAGGRMRIVARISYLHRTPVEDGGDSERLLFTEINFRLRASERIVDGRFKRDSRISAVTSLPELMRIECGYLVSSHSVFFSVRTIKRDTAGVLNFSTASEPFLTLRWSSENLTR